MDGGRLSFLPFAVLGLPSRPQKLSGTRHCLIPASRQSLAQSGVAGIAGKKSQLSSAPPAPEVTYLGKCPTFGQFEAKVEFTGKLLTRRFEKPQQVVVV